MERRIIEIVVEAKRSGVKVIDEQFVEDAGYFVRRDEINHLNLLLNDNNFITDARKVLEQGLVNAYDELIDVMTKNNKSVDDVLCMNVYINTYRNDDLYDYILQTLGEEKEIIINNVEDLDKLKDVYYDRGYGNQVVEGVIIFKDKSFMERQEYDGSETWRYVDINKMIEECRKQ